ncbi:hypothetical protein CLV98_106225 [Dyadobacter jejuensis]|uniref:Uncharacterized protein n=1 Tax=Dyadobacter jejuensis TaxID=1082580 RepID=A0A316AJ37_9BACT|nr:hypothetical protein [Dyadobacter jejuensis]PWJ57753.1 hypothetical protein CLV98_106225 [Dyadobacter jejuensis]
MKFTSRGPGHCASIGPATFSYVAILSGLLSMLLLGSCMNPAVLTTSQSVKDIPQLAYFPSLAYIQHIEKGNQAQFNDSLSSITAYKLDSLLGSHSSTYHLSESIWPADGFIKMKTEIEINQLIQMVRAKRNLNAIPLPPTLDSLMEARDQRYAMAVIGAGFGRVKGNFRGQLAKGVGIGILTLGMYAPVPVKSNLSLFTLVIDAQENKVVYYRRSTPVEKSPTSTDVIHRELTGLLNKTFQ